MKIIQEGSGTSAPAAQSSMRIAAPARALVAGSKWRGGLTLRTSNLPARAPTSLFAL
jgi:hypothetical protein